MKTCITCAKWVAYDKHYPGGSAVGAKRAGGYCTSSKIVENYEDKYDPDMLVYPYCEGGEFWTGPNFGCVHHKSS